MERARDNFFFSISAVNFNPNSSLISGREEKNLGPQKTHRCWAQKMIFIQKRKDDERDCDTRNSRT